jgi:hypothetical protein
MRAEEFEGMRPSELAEQAEARGIVPFAGESRRELCQRMAAYDATIGGARDVSLFGGIKARRAN